MVLNKRNSLFKVPLVLVISVIFFLILNCENLLAGTYRFNRARTTTGQEFIYLQNILAEILGPANYQVDIQSIHITEDVAMPPMHTPVIFETPEFAIHSVSFEASHQSEILKGFVYLVILNDQKLKNSNLTERIILNSTARILNNYNWGDLSTSTLILSSSFDFRLFKAEIRPQDIF